MTLLERQFARLRGQTAWIIGGKRIGLTVARALAEQGVNLIVNYRTSKSEAEEAVASAQRLGVKARTVQADATDYENLQQAVESFRGDFPHIHILVNMSSIFEKVELENITPDLFRRQIEADLMGTFWPTRAALPLMERGGHIINFADRTSVGPVYTNYLPYVVAKGGVHNLTRALAKELAPRGIFVNAIAPGPILPPEHFSPDAVAKLRDSSPLKFPIDSTESVEQFALLVLYLSVITMSSGGIYSLDQGQNL